MANGSGAAVAGLIVGIIIVSQAGGPEGDTGNDREPEVPRAVEGGLAASHTDDHWAGIGTGALVPVNPRLDDRVCRPTDAFRRVPGELAKARAVLGDRQGVVLLHG